MERGEEDDALTALVSDQQSTFDMTIFRGLLHQLNNEPSTVDWDRMMDIDPSMQMEYSHLKDPHPDILRRVVVLKLNGGLGTSMGCCGPKSLIELREGLTFLDIALRQVQALNERFSCDVPLLLMNSFNTEQATRQALMEMKNKFDKVNIKMFTQSRCPRLFADTLRPVPRSNSDRLQDGWYPPGHGNVFVSLKRSGLLDELLSNGRDICFISNIDNTGANVDLKIAGLMAETLTEYLMEMTEKTMADVKGGTLVKVHGRIMHLEMPQVPEKNVEEFSSLTRFKMFNTNNIWVNLNAVRTQLPSMRMEIIVNPKKLNNGQAVLQLETSVGGAIRNFDRALCVNVPRSRFLPVKKTQDMLAMMSNVYTLNREDFVLRLNPTRLQPPFIFMSSPHFDTVSAFHQRIPHIPDLLELDELKVIGPVSFGKGIKLKGRVELKANGEEELWIEDDRIIQDQIVTSSSLPRESDK